MEHEKKSQTLKLDLSTFFVFFFKYLRVSLCQHVFNVYDR